MVSNFVISLGWCQLCFSEMGVHSCDFHGFVSDCVISSGWGSNVWFPEVGVQVCDIYRLVSRCGPVDDFLRLASRCGPIDDFLRMVSS